jgi:hypothetical protein
MGLVISKGLTLRKDFLWNETVWNPSMISTALWLDAADASTVTTESGAVSQWNDKSGNGRHVSQASSGSRPTFNATGQNSKGIINFNGTSSFLERVQTDLSTNWTCVIAAKNNITTGFPVFVGQSSTTLTNPRWQLDRGDTSARMIRRNDAGAIQLPSQGTHTASAFIQAGTNDGSLIGVSLNGAALTTAAAVTGTFTTNRLTVGALYAGSGSATAFLNGSMFEVVYAPSMLATLDRQKLEGYLAHKWGLTANLPSDHPYKTVGPTP